MSTHNRSKLTKILFTMTIGVFAMLSDQAQAINLQQLFDGDSIAINNTVFRDWQLAGDTDASAGFEPDFTQIEVVPIQSSRSVGLRSNTNDSWSTIGDTFIDTVFSYNVATTNGTTSIVASQLELLGFEFEDLGGTINLIEELSGQGGDLVALNDVFADNLGGDSFLLDSVVFNPQPQISVATSILVFGDFDEDVVRLNTLEQRFTTNTVPEPATFGLFAASALAITARRRTA